MRCPLCNTELADGAEQCTRCDWVRRRVAARPVTTRDEIAFWLSLVPGLGHLYKGWVVAGGLLFFVVGPVVLVIAVATLTPTFGLSLLLLPIFLGFVMLHAVRAQDRRMEAIRKAREMDRAAPAH
jgi:hypothetical protein